jgi:hypothetical protein
MRIVLSVLLTMAGVCGGAWASEPGCYRTVEAAATQSGARGVAGFRLDSRQRDVFSGAVWVTVKSCAHPEQPGVLVMVGTDATRVAALPRHEAPALVVLSGAKVTLIERDEVVRIEMQGVTQSSGSVGDHVKVRLLALGNDGTERFVDGIVRGSDVVEVVAR